MNESERETDLISQKEMEKAESLKTATKTARPPGGKSIIENL